MISHFVCLCTIRRLAPPPRLLDIASGSQLCDPQLNLDLLGTLQCVSPRREPWTSWDAVTASDPTKRRR